MGALFVLYALLFDPGFRSRIIWDQVWQSKKKKGLVEGSAFMTSDNLSDVSVSRFSPCLTLLDSGKKKKQDRPMQSQVVLDWIPPPSCPSTALSTACKTLC